MDWSGRSWQWVTQLPQPAGSQPGCLRGPCSQLCWPHGSLPGAMCAHTRVPLGGKGGSAAPRPCLPRFRRPVASWGLVLPMGWQRREHCRRHRTSCGTCRVKAAASVPRSQGDAAPSVPLKDIWHSLGPWGRGVGLASVIRPVAGWLPSSQPCSGQASQLGHTQGCEPVCRLGLASLAWSMGSGAAVGLALLWPAFLGRAGLSPDGAIERSGSHTQFLSLCSEDQESSCSPQLQLWGRR